MLLLSSDATHLDVQANHSPFKLIGDILAWLQLLGAVFDAILQVRNPFLANAHHITDDLWI